jgi:carbamoyl-phosphate synthase large subunit
MGVGRTFGEAFAKAQSAASSTLPRGGRAFVSVRDRDKPGIADVARSLVELGFEIHTTRGTANVLDDAGIDYTIVNKVTEGRPHIVDMIKNDDISLIINTTEGKQAIADSYTIRSNALQHKVIYTTTLAGAKATCQALQQLDKVDVNSLQDLHKETMA